MQKFVKNEFPGDADVPGPGTTLWVARCYESPGEFSTFSLSAPWLFAMWQVFLILANGDW